MSKISKIRFQNLLTKDEEEEIKAVEAGRVKFEKEVIRKYWRQGFNAMHDSKGFHATAAEPQLGPNNIVGVGLS